MKIKVRGWQGLLLFLVIAAAGLTACRYWGLRGWQQAELSVFDRFVSRQPPQLPDGRIAIVGITEGDLQSLSSSTPDDRTLAKLLSRIEQQQPRAIGLDVLRDFPVPPGSQQLEEIFQSSPHLFGVGKFTGMAGDRFFEPLAPPPILAAKGQVGDVSVMVDADGTVRRGNFFPSTGEKAIPSLGLILASVYLRQEGILDQKAHNGDLKLGKVAFPFFEPNDGGYIGADASGYQVLMNWYAPPQGFDQVSVSDVLSGKVPSHFFQDKIVLIGYYTTSEKKDLFYTPLSNLEKGKTPRKAFGVEIHANLAQYVLKTVLDGYPLLKGIPESIEVIWTGSWMILSGLLVWLFRRTKAPALLILMGLGSGIMLSFVCYEIHFYLFKSGWWLPIFSSVVAVGVGSQLSLLYLFREKNLDYIENLEAKVRERTDSLEKALATIKANQQQLIEQEKLAFLGRLTAGFCHQFKNPLYQLKYGFSTVIQIVELAKNEWTEAEREMVVNLLTNLQEPIEKLELIFKLILISPSQKKVTYIEASPNEFVESVAASVLRYHTNHTLSSQVEKKFASELSNSQRIPQQLEIPLFNILENALDAVSQRQKRESNFQPQIFLETSLKEGILAISVGDNGGGISPEIEDHLFEPFQTTKTETQGIGLGLFISQEVMERIGGEIAVSTDEKGSLWVLKVPPT